MGEAVDYSKRSTPSFYVCGKCGARGVRLFRRYNTFLDSQFFTCRACSEAHQDAKWDGAHPACVGWLVLAVPTPDGETFWGYTSVPQAGLDWWFALPWETSDA